MRGNTDGWTCYIRPMNAVRLHFPEPGTEALPLPEGRHRIGWRDDRLGLVTEQATALITFKVDPRGIWMNVAGQAACVHVNGRRVYTVALLRSGDVLHLDHVELRLCADARALPPSPPQTAPEPQAADPRLLLRALSGPDHGRCLTLDRPRLIGRSARVDVQIDESACDECDVRLEPAHGQVLLRHLRASGRTLVNGQIVHEAVLMAGDQVVFGPRHRFVIESPQVGAPPPVNAPPTPVLPPSPQRPLRGLLWLLAAAGLLAAVLAGVLLLGPV